jgi:RNA polymerase sigma factor (sigma-70 family)
MRIRRRMNRALMERLIRSIVRRLQCEYGGTEWDDLESQAWLIVAEKIDGYDKGRGASLSTYLYGQVEGELRHYIERVVLRGLHLNGRRIHMDQIPDPGRPDGVDAKIMLEQMVSLETGLDRDVLLCMIGGKDPTETAKELKVSRQRVNQILLRIRRKYNEEAKEMSNL